MNPSFLHRKIQRVENSSHRKFITILLVMAGLLGLSTQQTTTWVAEEEFIDNIYQGAKSY
jgi:hypothetical protein